MENVMPQLNLANRALQQTMASQVAVRKGKPSQKDRFSDLLQNPSGRKAANEKKTEENVLKTGSKPEAAEKTEEQPAVDTSENVQGKGTEDGEKEIPAAAEEMAGSVNAELLMIQFLTDSGPAIQQTDLETEAFVELVPEVQTGELTNSISLEDGSEGEQIVLQSSFLGKISPREGAAEIEENSEIVMPEALVSNDSAAKETVKPPLQHPVKETSQKSEMPKETENISIPAEQTEASNQESGTLSEETQEEQELFSNLSFSAENIPHQSPVFNQVQETAQPQPLIHMQAGNSQELMNQLMQHLREKVMVGNQEFEIQIHPENLGRLSIKVAYMAEKVSISIVCSNEKTMEVLSAGAKNIAQIMEENLGTPTTVVVDHQEENYLEQYKNQQGSQQQQQQEKKEEKERNSGETQDFLQQLRLGLI